MKLNEIYGSNSSWLKADDIKGQRPIVTIATAEVKENTYDGETKKQIVLTFEGKDKQLGLNVTNANRIAELTETEDFDEWVGVSIKLYVEKVPFGDKMVDAIRVMPELPEAPKAAAKAVGKKAQFTGNEPPPEPPFDPSDEDDPSNQIPF